MCLNVFLLISSVSCVLAAYPTTYPFESEEYVPSSFPASTPDWSFEPTDPGGYTYYGHIEQTMIGGDITDDNFPFVHHFNGFTMNLLVVIYGAPPVLPLSNWNCTTKGTIFLDSDFTGEIDGNTYCEIGSCCTDLIGVPKYGEDQMTWHTWSNERSASGLCGVVQTEALYCMFVGGHHHLNCQEFAVSPTERLVDIFPCYDNAIKYWLTCAVFKSVYVFQYIIGAQEPATYTEGMAVDEQMAMDGLFIYPDRVCNPYSYYHPAAASSTTGTTGSTSSTSPAFLTSILSVLFAMCL